MKKLLLLGLASGFMATTIFAAEAGAGTRKKVVELWSKKGKGTKLVRLARKRPGRARSIAILGDPGAGKTTVLKSAIKKTTKISMPTLQRYKGKGAAAKSKSVKITKRVDQTTPLLGYKKSSTRKPSTSTKFIDKTTPLILDPKKD